MIKLLLDLKALFYSLFTPPSVLSLLFSHSVRVTRHRGMYMNLQFTNLQVDYSKTAPKAMLIMGFHWYITFKSNVSEKLDNKQNDSFISRSCVPQFCKMYPLYQC